MYPPSFATGLGTFKSVMNHVRGGRGLVGFLSIGLDANTFWPKVYVRKSTSVLVLTHVAVVTMENGSEKDC